MGVRANRSERYRVAPFAAAADEWHAETKVEEPIPLGQPGYRERIRSRPFDGIDCSEQQVRDRFAGLGGEARPDGQTSLAVALLAPVRERVALEPGGVQGQWKNNAMAIEERQAAEVAPVVECVGHHGRAMRLERRDLAAEVQQVGKVGCGREEVDGLQSL